MKTKLDIGCGKEVDPEFIGLDMVEREGVDVVWDLSRYPWPFEDNQFEYIKAIHVIEHIDDQVGFFREVHRISRPGGIVHLETPHFSSADSWADPTHVRHFSMFFPDAMTGDGYLVASTGQYEVANRRVNFGALIDSIRARLLVKLFGYKKWEKYAFRYPGINIYVDLKVVK